MVSRSLGGGGGGGWPPALPFPIEAHRPAGRLVTRRPQFFCQPVPNVDDQKSPSISETREHMPQFARRRPQAGCATQALRPRIRPVRGADVMFSMPSSLEIAVGSMTGFWDSLLRGSGAVSRRREHTSDCVTSVREFFGFCSVRLSAATQIESTIQNTFRFPRHRYHR